jgi:hypothetical protein
MRKEKGLNLCVGISTASFSENAAALPPPATAHRRPKVCILIISYAAINSSYKK